MFIGVTRRKRLERAKGNNYWIVAKYIQLGHLALKWGQSRQKHQTLFLNSFGTK